MKILIPLFLAAAGPLSAQTIYQYQLTTATYAYNGNWLTAVQAEFGQTAQVADFANLKLTYNSNPQLLVALLGVNPETRRTCFTTAINTSSQPAATSRAFRSAQFPAACSRTTKSGATRSSLGHLAVTVRFWPPSLRRFPSPRPMA